MKELWEISASLTTDGRRRLRIQRERYKSYLDEELGLSTATTRDAVVETVVSLVFW